MTSGTVVAASRSAQGGVPKYPQPEVVVTPLGVEGDYHAGETRWSSTKRARVPNERTVTVVAAEALDDLNAALGTSLKAGDLAENFLVRGFGDLSDVRAGDRFVLESATARVVLRVTEQNYPCRNLAPYHEDFIKTATVKDDAGRVINRRGVLCVVDDVRGDGRVGSGASVALERAAPAAQ